MICSKSIDIIILSGIKIPYNRESAKTVYTGVYTTSRSYKMSDERPSSSVQSPGTYDLPDRRTALRELPVKG